MSRRRRTADADKEKSLTPKEVLLSAMSEIDPTFKKTHYAKKTKKDLEQVIVILKRKVDNLRSSLESKDYQRNEIMQKKLGNTFINFRSTKAGNLAGETNTVKPLERFKGAKKDLRDQIRELEGGAKDAKELISLLCDASDSIDPVAFHMSVMNGFDPRIVSIISSMLDIILYDMKDRGESLPNSEEWEMLTETIVQYYSNETVSMMDSMRAAGELLSVSTPRLKQIEQTVTAPPSKLEQIGVNPEAIKALPKEDAKEFLRIIKVIKANSLTDESEA